MSEPLRNTPVSKSTCERIAALVDETPSGELDSPSTVEQLQECVDLLARIWPDTRQGTRAVDGSGAETAPPAASRFARFEIRRWLGSGGFGVVYQVYDPLLEREAALKIPRPEVIFSPALKERFLREAQAAATLDHRGIIPIYETGQWGPAGYILSGYCSGPTLSAWLDQQPAPVDVRRGAGIVLALAEAVHHAHTRGILHRDIKPSNVLLEIGPAGEVMPKLTDFGLAKRVASETETRDGALLGTPAYMPPEQAMGQYQSVGVQSDVYSLGVILYELLCGRPPHRADSDAELLQQIRVASPPAPRSLRREVPLDLQTICLKCLEKEPGGRYESAQSLAADLRRFLTGECVAARPVSLPTRSLRWCRRHPLVAALVALVMITAGAGVVGIFNQWLRAERNLALARRQTSAAQQQADRARRNLQQAEHALNDLSWLVEETALWSNVESHARRHLRRRLADRYDQLYRERAISQTSTPLLAAMYSLRAREAWTAGDDAQARENFAHSMRTWQAAARAEPSNLGFRRALTAVSMSYLEYLDARDDNEALFQFLTDADSQLGRFWLEKPGDLNEAEAGLQIALSLAQLAGRMDHHDQPDRAAVIYRTSANIAGQAAEAFPEEPRFRFARAQFLRLVGAQRRPASHPDAAQPANDESLALLEQLVEEYPREPVYRRDLVELRRQRGLRARRKGTMTDAAWEFAEAVRHLEVLLAATPGDAELMSLSARCLRRLGGCQEVLGKTEASLTSMERSCRTWHKLYSRGQLPVDDQREFAMTARRLGLMAHLYDDQPRLRYAVEIGPQAYQCLQQSGQMNSNTRMAFATWLPQLASLARHEGDRVGALQHYEDALELWSKVGRHPHNDLVARRKSEVIRRRVAELQPPPAE